MFERSLRLIPDRPSTLLNLSLVQLGQGKMVEAKVAAERLSCVDPDNAAGPTQIGAIYLKQGLYDLALSALMKAIKKDPHYYEAHNVCGNVLRQLNRLDDALVHFDKALTLNPAYATACSNGGNVLLELRRFDEALARFDRAILLDPQDAAAHFGRGSVLIELQRLDEALIAYEKCVALKPDLGGVLGAAFGVANRLCSWKDYYRNLRTIIEATLLGKDVCNPFVVMMNCDDPRVQLESSQIFSKRFFSSARKMGEKRAQHSRIRIGYFSSDFWTQHPMYQCFTGVVESHNREQFEIVGLTHGPMLRKNMKNRIIDSLDRHIDMNSFSATEAVEVARELELDIAVDLNGYTHFSRPDDLPLKFHPAAFRASSSCKPVWAG